MQVDLALIIIDSGETINYRVTLSSYGRYYLSKQARRPSERFVGNRELERD